MNVQLYLAQRISAAAMAPFILVHLALMIAVIKGGLTAAEILGRTRGSFLWGGFYEAFVMAAAVHASIGVHTITKEWGGVDGRPRDAVALAAGALLLGLGSRAVYAVVLG